MNGHKDTILKRVKEALQMKERAGTVHKQAPTSLPVTEKFEQWMPDPGTDFERWLEVFTENSKSLKTEIKLASDVHVARMILDEMRKTEDWESIACAPTPLVKEATSEFTASRFFLEKGYNWKNLERANVGITECEFLVAQTGSIMVTSVNSGGRALSVLPPHHVVIARKSQLVPDLRVAYELLQKKYKEHLPSFIGFITGPSRTGDIERILVLGAHGPKKLSLLLLD